MRRYGLSTETAETAETAGVQERRSACLRAAKLLQDSVYGYEGAAEDKQGTSGSMFAGRPAMAVPKV